MKHSQEIQERLIKQVSLWRFQGEMFGRNIDRKGLKKEAKVLEKLLKTFDQVWFDEFGSGYIDEVLRLAKRFDEINSSETDKKVTLKLVKNGGAND